MLKVLTDEEVKTLHEDLHTNWKIQDAGLEREFVFKGYLKTMSFVNAVAWVAQNQMHHPDMQVSFNKAFVRITTHDAGNKLTEKDFLLARSIDELNA